MKRDPRTETPFPKSSVGVPFCEGMCGARCLHPYVLLVCVLLFCGGAPGYSLPIDQQRQSTGETVRGQCSKHQSCLLGGFPTVGPMGCLPGVGRVGMNPLDNPSGFPVGAMALMGWSTRYELTRKAPETWEFFVGVGIVCADIPWVRAE